MKTSLFRSLVALALTVLPLAAACAQPLPSGTYRASAEFGAVLLDGRYPLAVEELPGLLEVSTWPTGALTGYVTLLNQRFEVTGQLTSRKGYNRIVLRSRVAEARLLLKASLQAGQFVGTLQLGERRMSCQFDVSATAPLRGEYVLALTVASNGAISGPGTLTVARQKIPVRVRGRVARDNVSLTLRGGKTFLKTSTGQLKSNGVSARKWTAHAFGALVKGTDLQVSPATP